jgi:Response regulator containing CheY-like receiver, AAA-type ATPase, and DNA-binding domains
MHTILIVDDSAYLVDLFSKMLQRGGYQTIVAYSGEECISVLEKAKPDLILLDIMMDGMDGWETLIKIKENSSTSDIPVMMETAKQLTPEEAENYYFYIEGYIMKPVTQKMLHEAIQHVFDRRAAIEITAAHARDAGVLPSFIEEYKNICRIVDVNSQLRKILGSIYMEEPFFSTKEETRLSELKKELTSRNIPVL